MQERDTEAAIRDLLAETAESLAKLDADRLEALVQSSTEFKCQRAIEGDAIQIRDQRGLKRDMDALAKMLNATRANLAVIKRLYDAHASRNEYLPGLEPERQDAEARDGVN